jgi:hypothetical protein
MPPAIPKLKGAVGGKGAANDRDDVLLVQQILNKVIANGDLPGFTDVAETGKMDSYTLKVIHAFQRMEGLDPPTKVEDVTIEPDKGTIKALAKNRLVDSRWSEYDQKIKTEVSTLNKKFAATTPNFKELDWRKVKAMVWVEVQAGPDSDAWKSNPLQIGNAGDPGLPALKEGKEHTDLIVSDELRTKLKQLGKMNAEIGLKAGVAWLFRKAAKFEHKEVVDSAASSTYTMKAGDTLEKIARDQGTTIDILMKDNAIDAAAAKKLQPGKVLKFRKAHKQWQISGWQDWDQAIKDYNGGGDPKYLDKVTNEFKKIARFFEK